MTKFEGDLTGVDPKQVEFINSVLEKHGFQDAKVTLKAVGEAGDNYVANVKRIIAEKNGETFKMVAKIAPSLEQLRMTGQTNALFQNEYVMYNEVLPKFTQMEEAADIPETERLRYAKFYGAFMEEPLEIILLEDLQVPGFIMLDRFKSIPNEAIKLVLRSFAILHSRSYALKSKEPDTFAAFKKSLVNPWALMAADENIRLFFTSLEEDARNMLSEDRHKAAVKDTCSKLDKLQATLYKTDSESRYSVIQQGDSWTNNIMFRLQDGTPKECCMIDYQIAKVNNPVADLHYMIFACSDYEGRSKHFQEWIDYYHSELEKNLFEFGLKVEYCYPREQLEADLKRHGKMSLAQAIMLASVLTRETAEAAKMKEAMESFEGANIEEMLQNTRISSANEVTASLFTSRVGEAIDSLQELGYIG